MLAVQNERPSLFNSATHYPLKIIKKNFDFIDSTIKNSFPYACCYRLKNLLIPSEEKKQLDAMILNAKFDLDFLTQMITGAKFFKLRVCISAVLEKLTDEQLNELLKKLFESQINNPQLLIKKLNSLLTLAKIEKAVQSEFATFKTFTTAQEIADFARREIEEKKSENRMGLLRLTHYYITTTLSWIVDTFLFVFMLRDISDGDATNTERQMVATMQWQAFRENIAFISAWLIALAIYTGTALQAAAIAATIAVPLITIAVIYMKYFKPPPANIHPAKNLTKLAVQGKLPKVLFREKIENQVMAILEMNAVNPNYRLYPLLIGESGIGKTEVCRNVAKRLHLGDGGKNLAQIVSSFIVNGSWLVEDELGKPEHLHNIEELLKGYEKNVFFTIDEAQIILKLPLLRNLFLSLMDPNGLPFMAFTCTKKDYEKYKEANSAFLRRVKVIEVPSLTEEETKVTLSQEIAENFPYISISADVLKEVSDITLDERFAGCPQPLTSKRILYDAITKLRIHTLENEKITLAKEKDARKMADLEWQNRNDPVSYQYKGNEAAYISDNNLKKPQLNQQIIKLKKELAESTARLNAFKLQIADQLTLSKKVRSLAVKIEDNQASKETQKEFILLLNYLKPVLAKAIEQQKPRLGENCPEITLSIIRECIEEEYQRMQKENELKEQIIEI